MQMVGPILHIGWRKVSMYPRAFCGKLALDTLQRVLNHSALLSLEDVDADDRSEAGNITQTGPICISPKTLQLGPRES